MISNIFQTLSKISAAAVITTVFSSTAWANAIKLPDLPEGTPVSVEVYIGNDLAARAEKYTGSSTASTSQSFDAFGSNEYLGGGNLRYLGEQTDKEVRKKLKKKGIKVKSSADYKLNILLTAAKPSFPTKDQRRKSSTITQGSSQLGGAGFEIMLFGPDDKLMGSSTYSWYASQLDGRRSHMWQHSKKAIALFSDVLADEMAN